MAEKKPAESDESQQPPKGIVGKLRALILGKPLVTIPAAVGVLAVLGVGVWLLAGGEKAPDHPPSAEALAALDEGDYAKAAELAEVVRNHPAADIADDGVAAFVSGMVESAEGDRSVGAERRKHYLAAAQFFDEARKDGFPKGREADGWFYLGRSLHFAGRFAAARLALKQALQIDEERKPRILWLMAEAHLKDTVRDLDAALAYNDQFLAIEGLAASARSAGILQRIRIQLELKNADEVRRLLGKLPPSQLEKPAALLLKGRLKMLQAEAMMAAGEDSEGETEQEVVDKQNALLNEAIALFQEAQQRDRLGEDVAPEAMYLAGECYKSAQQYEEAIAQFQRTWRRYPQSQAAWAAEFRAADLARRLGRDDESLTEFAHVMATMPPEDEFSCPWVTLDEVRSAVRDAYDAYRAAKKYDRCLALTDVVRPALPLSQVYEMEATAHREWGDLLFEQAQTAHKDQVEGLLKQARRQHRLAGDDYARLAIIRVTTRFYADDLWNAAECYLSGKCYSRAARALREYLLNETKRRNSLALLQLGKCLMALGKYDEAITVLEECIEFHRRDAASYEARLLAAHAYQEKDDFERAEKLLRENLSGMLAPSSIEWRDSLFALGKFLFLKGAYPEAIEKLEEAVFRYPDAPAVTEALYLLGESHRRIADEIGSAIEKELVQNIRLARSRKIGEHLTSALNYYRRAQETLAERQESGNLSELDRRTMRNLFFASGEVLYRLGRYSEAVKEYTAVTNRFQDDPAILEAYVQLARNYRAMNRPDQAHVAVEQAKILLRRLNPKIAYTQTTNYDAQQWAERLDWLSAL
ncbi:hypothetical protein JCM19992_14110 [Thermostilla marina]